MQATITMCKGYVGYKGHLQFGEGSSSPKKTSELGSTSKKKPRKEDRGGSLLKEKSVTIDEDTFSEGPTNKFMAQIMWGGFMSKTGTL